MKSPAGIPTTILFFVIRLVPLFSSLGFVVLADIPFERTTLLIDRFLRAFIVLLVWSIAEGVLMLWVREKNAGSQRTRGYGAVACILGIIVLVMLQAFRGQATQSQFLILLAVLAIRGMSRSSWEQGRPKVAAITAPLSHVLLSFLSFLMMLDILSWQAAVVGLAVGALTGAVDTTWHASKFRGDYPDWLLPLYRLSISFPAVAISSLSLIQQLPSSYIINLSFLILSTRYTWNQGKPTDISNNRFIPLAGLYILFIGLVVGALIYS